MASSQSILPSDVATTPTQIRPWQGILWREWRNCNDKEYANHLFELVIDEPIDHWGMVVFILFTALWGGLGGWLLAQLLYPQNLAVNWELWAVAGVVAGGVLGLLVMRLLKLTSHATWRFWLPGLIPNTLTGEMRTQCQTLEVILFQRIFFNSFDLQK